MFLGTASQREVASIQLPSMISQRAVALKPSLTLAINARAKALKEEGIDTQLIPWVDEKEN